jgi:hypothetical protein
LFLFEGHWRILVNNCKITILETPIYSIYNWNKHRRYKTPKEFKNQDSLLAEQVVKLNFKVKEINDNIDSHSPKFSKAEP